MTGTTMKTMTTSQAINSALHEAMRSDPSVIVFGEDVADREGGGVFKATLGLSTAFGSTRVRSTPIAEQAIVGAAIGAALAGMRPVVEIMLMNFATVAMDQIINHAAKLRFMSGGQSSVPITIRMATGAGRGTGGQHADYLEAWFAHTAGLKVVAPSSPSDAKGLLLACIQDDDPCIFIENMSMYRVSGQVPDHAEPIPLGKAHILREGAHATVIAYSRIVNDVVAAADALAREGIMVEVIDLRTISPLDMPTILRSVEKTGRALVVHEAVRNFGVGAEIAAAISEKMHGRLLAPVGRLASSNGPVPFSKPLEAAHVPGVTQIEAAVRSLLDPITQARMP